MKWSCKASNVQGEMINTLAEPVATGENVNSMTNTKKQGDFLTNSDDIRWLSLSTTDCAVLMGAISTFSGVPFIRIRKPDISQLELDELDRIHETIVEARNNLRDSRETRHLHPIPVADCNRILNILENCKHEYSGIDLDLRIHLSTACESDLEDLIGKFRRVAGVGASSRNPGD